jgi:two-component system response regulator (stage 0 sporulation protein A)
MKTKINVLLIDDNESITRRVVEYFGSHAVIKVVKAINDGHEAMDYILSNPNKFDLVLMDIIMPEVDGIEILEEMHKHQIKKNVIILTSYKKESTIKMVSKYDVDYYMLKPFDLKTLEKRIVNIMDPENAKEVNTQSNKVEIEISKVLHSLGIPSHIRGYQYIRESIYMMYKNPGVLGGITKTIYPEIAQRYDTTSSRVERAIRHAIEVSWARGDIDLMEELFGHSVDYDRSKPTNSEFIATIADNLKINKRLITA